MLLGKLEWSVNGPKLARKGHESRLLFVSVHPQAKRVGRIYPSLRLSLSLVNQLPGQTPTSHQELPGHQIDDWVVGEWG